MSKSDDLIRRSGVIKIIDDNVNGSDNRLYLKDLINSIPSADAVQGWIPCSERLPDEEGEYIATVSADGGHMYIGIIYYGKPLIPNRKVNGKCWYHSDDEWGDVVYDDDDIFAWIQLPEPYKGGERDG